MIAPRSQFLFVLLAPVVLGAGCSSDASGPVPVSGVVLYAQTESPQVALSGSLGHPVPDAKVTFYRDRQPVGFGTTDRLGRFRAKTYLKHGDAIDGLEPGEYIVTIERVPLVPPKESDGEAFAALPSRYADPETSPERRSVLAHRPAEPATGNYFQFRLLD